MVNVKKIAIEFIKVYNAKYDVTLKIIVITIEFKVFLRYFKEKMKKSFILCLLILIFILCSCAPKLNPININEVRRIYAIQTIEGVEVLNDFDDYKVSEFVSWYNECEDIRSNKEFAGIVTLQYSILTLPTTKVGGFTSAYSDLFLPA